MIPQADRQIRVLSAYCGFSCQQAAFYSGSAIGSTARPYVATVFALGVSASPNEPFHPLYQGHVGVYGEGSTVVFDNGLIASVFLADRLRAVSG